MALSNSLQDGIRSSSTRGKREYGELIFGILLTYIRYAEMDKVEKNKISHRFRALEKLKLWLEGT